MSGWEDSDKSFLQAPLVKPFPDPHHRPHSISLGDAFEKSVSFGISEHRTVSFQLDQVVWFVFL